MQRYLEPIDVEEDDQLVGHDADGHKLRLIATSPRVTIHLDESEPSNPEELRQILITFLSYLGVAKELLENELLQQLVKMSLKYKTK